MSYVLHHLSRWCFGLSLGLLGLVAPVVAQTTLSHTFTAQLGTRTFSGTLTETATAGTYTFVGTASNAVPAGSAGLYTTAYWVNGVQTTLVQIAANASSSFSKTVVLPVGGTIAGGGNWNGSTYNSPVTLFTRAGSQTASLSPDGGAASIVEGQTFVGTASGAQGGNPYNISIVSGPGSASINSSTGAYTVTANGSGLIHYKVWISAGGGYTRSPDAESNIAVTNSAKVKVTVPANNGSYPIVYKLWQNGVVVGTHTQMPGASAFIVVLPVSASDGPVTMTSQTQGVMINDGIVTEVPGGVIDNPETTLTPSIDPPTTVVPPPPDVKAPGTSVTSKLPRVKVTWGASGQGSTPSTQTDILTNKTYREGVEKQLEQSGIELKLADERPSESDMESKGQAAKAEAEASLSEVGSSIGTATPPEGEAGSFVVGTGTLSSMISNAWNQAVIGINPVVAWIKALIRWAITLLYVFWVYKELDRKLVTSMMLPQAKGNPVLGGTGAQLTGLAAAALISAALLTIPFLLWAAYTTPWDGVANATDSLKNIAAAPIASSLPAVQLAMKWLAWLLPLDMLLAIPPMVLVVKKAGWAIILGVAALIRFIVP